MTRTRADGYFPSRVHNGILSGKAGRTGSANEGKQGLMDRQSNSGWKWATGTAVIVALVFVVGVAIIFRSHRAHAPAASKLAVPVTAARALRHDVPIYLSGLGTVTADNSVTITSQVGGQIVSEPFHQGEMVQAGQLLVRINPAPYQAALDQAIGRQKQDRATLAGAEQDLARYATLVRENYASQQKYTDQKALVAQDAATVEADAAAVEAARINLGFTRIVAPISGRVGLRLIDVGNVVSAGTTSAICTIMQIDPITVVFTLPQQKLEDVLAAMTKGNKPAVVILDGTGQTALAKGRLLTIDNQVDTATGTFRLKAIIPNDGNRLWPGQFVRARLLVDTLKGVTTVPENALQRGPDGYYVYRVLRHGENRTVERVAITVRARSNGAAVVSRGLEPGDEVVTGGASRLANGSIVTVTRLAS